MHLRSPEQVGSACGFDRKMAGFVPRLKIVKLPFLARVALGLMLLGCSQAETDTPLPSVILSEIMYHPVGEASAEDEHEFVELYNSGPDPVSLSGWKLRVDSEERLSLPAETLLEPNQYLVLAKNKQRLLSVPRYALGAASVIGDYRGQLDNGGATVALLDGTGRVVDSVSYDDDAPWPMGADAFGAQEAWLPALAPFSSHAFMGRSLERIDPKQSGTLPQNWDASAVDGATPGKANGVSGAMPRVVLSTSSAPEGSREGLIRAGSGVRIRAVLSEGGDAPVELEYRLDPVEKIGTSTTTVPMEKLSASGSEYSALLPQAAENTVVRYRILVRSAEAAVRIGPRPTDPRDWYAYFVSPEPRSGRSYHLFITPERWTTLWRNLSQPINQGCTVNQRWDATVPAVFVHEGKVYDVQVRYQGSRFQRKNGVVLSKWSAPGPSEPAPLQVFSWRVRFPRYAEFDKQRAINLNKLRQSCPGVLNALEGALFEKAGIPAQKFRFARFYVNGGYYNYAMEVQGVDQRTVEELEGPGNPIGDLFKADGSLDDGPWGRSNWFPLGPTCSMPVERRYEFSYERQTHDYKGGAGHAGLISLIEGLDKIHAGRDADPAVRSYFEKNFDVPKLISKFAIRNYAGVWDDGFHNFYVYHRPADGKWQLFPQDFDCDFGNCAEGNPATLSFFHPESPGGKTAGGTPELRLKTQLIKAFRGEFAAKISELDKTLFSESSISVELAKVLAIFDTAAWNESPARHCDLNARLAEAQSWLKNRRAFAAAGIR